VLVSGKTGVVSMVSEKGKEMGGITGGNGGEAVTQLGRGKGKTYHCGGARKQEGGQWGK